METIGGGDTSRNFLYVFDKIHSRKFLVDTGAEVSILPLSCTNSRTSVKLKLFAANNVKINTFGEVRLTLDLGLRRQITWNFCVADIPFAIIGADLLKHYRLSVNLHDRTLVDEVTSLSAKGKVTQAPVISISLIDRSSSFSKVLAEFPEVTDIIQDRVFTPRLVNHHLVTTGPPVNEQARRLSPEKLKVAKAEFKRMLELRLCRPSSSLWASPIWCRKKRVNGESVAIIAG